MAKRTAKCGFIEASSGNVFTDLGLPDAEELDTKLRLAVELNRLLKVRRLSQVRAATRLGISQPKVCAEALQAGRIFGRAADGVAYGDGP